MGDAILSLDHSMSREAPTPKLRTADSPLRLLLSLALATGLLAVSGLALKRVPCRGLFPLVVPVAWLV